ncbi:MAG: hypothetical protein JSW62_00490 [Thermoplasmatales archaeon]|nr:MAG: hypothetical protein JSW62_00490 [Thermoplasmatales archaeon]
MLGVVIGIGVEVIVEFCPGIGVEEGSKVVGIIESEVTLDPIIGEAFLWNK